jgi:hypothetical protein
MIALFAINMAISISPARDLNEGRALMQAGDLPAAIRQYRVAHERNRADADLQGDLQAARELVAYPRDELKPSAFSNWRDRISDRQIFFAYLAVLAVTVWVAIKYLTTRPTWSRAAFIACSILTMLLFVCGPHFEDESRDSASPFAVVKNAAVLRTGNGDSYPPRLDSPLPPGAEATVLHFRGGWVQVEFPSGIVGWLNERDLLLSDPAQVFHPGGIP